MTAQYAININYKIIKETAPVGMDVIEPIINQMSEGMKAVGWSVQKDELQDSLNLRFWLSENEINEVVEKELAARMSGVRGIIATGLNKVFGNQFAQQSTDMARKMLKTKVQTQAAKEIEQELSGLAGIDGITVIKGNKPLFEAQNPEPRKFKM